MNSPQAGWTWDDVDVRPLDGEPPAGFECGRDEQTEFLYEMAWRYHQAGFGRTYLVFIKGMFAAFYTLAADSITLGTGERDRGMRHPNVPAVKLAQVAVDVRFQRSGVGKAVIGLAVATATSVEAMVGCRYLTLDAQPDLQHWYESQGFKRNKTMQNEREARASKRGSPLDQLKISMRLDLRR